MRRKAVSDPEEVEAEGVAVEEAWLASTSWGGLLEGALNRESAWSACVGRTYLDDLLAIFFRLQDVACATASVGHLDDKVAVL